MRRKRTLKAVEPTKVGAEHTLAKADQYRELYAEWLSGVSPRVIAEKHNMTGRRVLQIADDLRRSEFAFDRDAGPLVGLEIIDRQLAQLEEAVSAAALLEEKAEKAGNLNAQLGAQKRKADAQRELLELRQARGLVPRNLSLLAVQADGMQLVAKLLNVLSEYPDVGEEIGRRVAEQIGMETRRGTDGRLELDMGPVVDGEPVD